MKFIISMIIGLGLTISSVAAEKKRKVAQEKMTCVPMGIPFNVYNDGDSSTYTAEELNLLRNSIYAQVGFRFNSAKITAEMAKRGCLKTDRKYDDKSLSVIDKKNASLLRSMENALKEEAALEDFQTSWNKAAKSAATRTNLLTTNYCYLSDADNKYFGILYFSEDNALAGMMNLEKPSWAIPEDERGSLAYSIAYKELDSTSASFVLDYSTKGKWSVDSKGQVLVTMNSDHKKLSNSVVSVTSTNYKQLRMLDCKLMK